jgi:uncharacterized Zn finger protein (UPF0148 family)
MFKEKSSKKRLTVIEGSKDCGTLGVKHQLMISQIQKEEEEKELLKQKHAIYTDELSRWKARIREMYLQNLTETPEYNNAWTSNLHYSDRLRDIEKKLKSSSDENKEVAYYENTANILFEYYDLIENEESMAGVNAVDTIKLKNTNQKSILEAFMVKDTSVSEKQPDVTTNKSTLVEKYMLLMDSNYVKNVSHPFVGSCNNCDIDLTIIIQEGMMICPICGYQELMLVEQNRPIYRQSNKEASNQSYKRVNHFNEWVSQIQGKESTEIPEEIFEKILSEIKKEQIKDTLKLSYNKMREILKKLKFNKYYEHIYYIIYRLNGISPPNFTPELEEKLRNMFKEIQGPFLKHCPDKRKNFLSYSYVLFKFCQLLEKDEYLKHFSLLKSREKLHVQDQIWRKICLEVRWEFIQSI